MAGKSHLRNLRRDAEKNFQGGGENITASPINSASPTQMVAEAKRGEREFASIPWMLPENARMLDREYASYRDERFDLTNQDDLREYRALMVAAATNAEAARDFAAYRNFEISADVMATPWSMGAFQMVDLSADELPMITRPQSRNLNEFTVRNVGVDGGSRRAQWRTTKAATTLEMDYLQTDRVNYPLVDLQQGDVSQAEAVRQTLAYDLEMHLDALALTNIDAAEVDSGLRDSLNIHSSVDTANIPDLNHLDLNAVDVATELSIGKLKTILEHVSKFGAAGGADEPISIQTIMISPQNIRDPWDFIDLVSDFNDGDRVKPKDTVTSTTRDSIFSSGMMTSAWGHNFSWTPNAQLAKGKMYVLTSQPLGWAFTKSAFDKTLVWDESNSPDHAQRNEAEILHKKAISIHVPDEWRYRVVIVDL